MGGGRDGGQVCGAQLGSGLRFVCASRPPSSPFLRCILVFFALSPHLILVILFYFFSPPAPTPTPPSPLHRLVGLASSPLVFVVRLLGYPVGHDAVAKAGLPTPHLPLPTNTTLRAFFPGSQGQPSQMSPADTQLSKDCIPGSKHSRQTMQLFLLTLENVKCFFSPLLPSSFHCNVVFCPSLSLSAFIVLFLKSSYRVSTLFPRWRILR